MRSYYRERKTVRYVIPPLDTVLYITNPTMEERLQQHARKLEIALEQGDTREAILEFNLMKRLYHDIRNTKPAR